MRGKNGIRTDFSFCIFAPLGIVLVELLGGAADSLIDKGERGKEHNAFMLKQEHTIGFCDGVMCVTKILENEKRDDGNKPKIICISGKAHSGKDFVASKIDYELANRGFVTQILHNADLLKYICREYLGWNGEKDENGRSLLQITGTKSFRSVNPNFWVDFLISLSTALFDTACNYILIPDVRFPNEISRWKEAGYDVIHVGVKRRNNESGLTSYQAIHESETALDNVKPDIVFENDVDAETPEFEAKIANLAHDIDKFFMTATKKEGV